ncbi:MAG: HEPN domain-containing protein [Anaerolineae bacterium]
MAKARSSLAAARKLLEELLFAESISRSYYAMFYAAKALLLLDSIDVSKHSAVIAAFGREYAKTGKIDPRYHRMLLDGFEWRQKSDYDVYWLATRKEAEKCLQDAEAFVAQAEKSLQTTHNRKLYPRGRVDH